MNQARRRDLVRTCKKYGLHVQPAALKAMLAGEDEDEERLLQLLQLLKHKLARTSPKIITPSLWEQVVRDLHENGSKKSAVEWELVQAFDTPKLAYDSLRQQFRLVAQTSRPPLLGTAEDKVEMMTQRYLRVQQRVVRQVTLTCVDRLLGTAGGSKPHLLLGMLRMGQNSSLELEDLTGVLPLKMGSETQLDDTGIYAEGTLVLAQGIYQHGVLHVTKVGLPPLESKEESTPFLPHTGQQKGNSSDPLSVYTMTNIMMDHPDVVEQLEDLISTMASQEDENVVLVLMGNFTTDSLTLSQTCDEIARMLDGFPHPVVIIPGPSDTPSYCWPLPPIAKRLAGALANLGNVQLASNPCRIEYEGHSILLTRNDVVRNCVRDQIIRPTNPEQSLSHRTFGTILAQGHLMPKTPIYWNYDHAMSLYPLPEAIMVGLERGDAPVDFATCGCQVVAPGPSGQWAKVTLSGSSGSSWAAKRRGALDTTLVQFSQEDYEEDEVLEPLAMHDAH